MALELADVHECVENPLKLKIIMLLARKGPMTAKMIQQALDVPQTSLYRALNSLQEADILRIVSETRVRAMVERTYDVSDNFRHFDVEMVKRNDLEGYCNLFSNFMLGLMRDFRDYAEDPDSDLRRDITGFASTGVYLTDEQAKELSWAMVGLLEPYLDRRSDDQKLHTLGFVLTPPQKGDRAPERRIGTIPERPEEAEE